MFPALNGKILLVFSDPGGAKPLLSYVLLASLKEYKIVSDRSYDFYKDFQLEVMHYNENDEVTILDAYQPDVILTGTSYTSAIELKFINGARHKGITVYSFIDHYTRFRDRFRMHDKYIFPDWFCLLDDEAQRIAVLEGFPPDRLLITGNPYHEYLVRWRPSASREQFFKKFDLPVNAKLILYAPDPLTNVGGITTYGLDEGSVFKALVDSIYDSEMTLQNLILGIKLHPNQNKSVLKVWLGEHDIRVADLSPAATNEALFHSDVIVGIFSSILIEAQLLKKTVIRLLPGLKTDDPLGSKGVGIIVQDTKALPVILKEILKK